MHKRLTSIGNSLGIIIEKPILELLGITKETPLTVRTDNGSRLIIEPVETKEDRAAKIREASKWVMENHGDTLRKLAE